MLVEKLAWPLVTATVASGIAPSEKVTVPFGMPATASAEVTLAVKVTGCPNSGLDVLATSEVDVVDTPSLAHSAHTSEKVLGELAPPMCVAAVQDAAVVDPSPTGLPAASLG